LDRQTPAAVVAGLSSQSEIYIGFIFLAASSPHRIYTPSSINLPSELEAVMLDAIFLGAGLAFFIAAILYTALCERL
jgi:hypothetical protein